jgi:UDP-glucose 4-epimerase
MVTRVLVTGGAGFIGSHLVDRLVNDGYEIRVIDNLSTGKMSNIQSHLNSGKVDFINGDIRDVTLVKESLSGVSKVVHLAALISVPLSLENPDLTFNVNLSGTLNLLRASIQEKISRFVFVSSCAVFGEPELLPIRETNRTNPISPYAESKLIAERYCLGFSHRHLLSSVVLRFFNVYGPRQGLSEYSGVITHFIDSIRRKVPLLIYGDGLQTRDFVNIKDVVKGVSAAIKSNKAEGEVFNIGSGKPTSIIDLAKTVSDLAGVELKVRFEEPRLGDIRDSFADISKANNLLHYRSEVSLRNGLRTLLEEE